MCVADRRAGFGATGANARVGGTEGAAVWHECMYCLHGCLYYLHTRADYLCPYQGDSLQILYVSPYHLQILYVSPHQSNSLQILYGSPYQGDSLQILWPIWLP